VGSMRSRAGEESRLPPTHTCSNSMEKKYAEMNQPEARLVRRAVAGAWYTQWNHARHGVPNYNRCAPGGGTVGVCPMEKVAGSSNMPCQTPALRNMVRGRQCAWAQRWAQTNSQHLPM
jgi:hypothetical protein